MEPIPLGISVSTWNTVKFVVLELFVSVVFASTWNLFLRRASARTLRSSAGVRLVSSGFGRFTPAEVGFYAIKRSNARTTCEDTEWRYHHRRIRAAICAVNLVLFALLFVLEYGSTDRPNFERRRVAVVTAQSIREHSRNAALREGSIKVLPESVRMGFRTESRKALQTLKDSPLEPSQFKLLEHTIDDRGELDSPGDAVKIDDVCGDNDVAQIPQCKKTLAPFLNKNWNEGRIVVARVTRVHPFVDRFKRIYDISIEYSVGLLNEDKIDMRPLRLAGTCNGHRFNDDTIWSTVRKSTVESDSCVLRETGSMRVFAFFPVKLTSTKLVFYGAHVTLLRRPDDSSHWFVPNATIFFQTDARGMLSFVPSIDIDTYTAALSMQQHESAYSNLYGLNSLDFAPFREYRRHVLLLCLGLFGEYFEQKHVRIALKTQQAAINTFFVVGLAGLVLVVFALAIASACMGATENLRVPVELRTQLRSIRSNSSQASENNSKWPEFELRNQPEFTLSPVRN